MTTPLENPSITPSALSSEPLATSQINREQWRQRLADQCPDLDPDTWWLLGTSGCHLCEVAETLIKRLQMVTPISYQVLDIVRLTETDMAAFATEIPVLLTPMARLNYPFSILDLQQLATQP